MKIAISGKGGVGKSTITALLAQVFADRGQQVIAVDTDPAPCLADALGFPADLRAQLRPIIEMKALIEERTGAKPGTSGGFFTINPRVDDIPDRFSVMHRGVRLLEMGGVQSGGGGCICPESAVLNTLFVHLLLRPNEMVFFDMYAGVEHLGRATVDFVDMLIIVVEPTRRSLRTAHTIRDLAHDIGLHKLVLVANKITDAADVDFVEKHAGGMPLMGMLHAHPAILIADRANASVYDQVHGARTSAEEIADALLKQRHERV